ncbi:MAG: hypothetical protein J6K51_05970 [Clostridia bacterium]|nr:hypothetical protein [Clostridia bacterium]
MKQKFLIIGGDLRQIACAKRLREKGYAVTLYGFFDIYLKDLEKSKNLTEDIIRADYVLLPLPVTKDGTTVNTPLWDETISLTQLTDALRDRTVVFGGMIKDPWLINRDLVFDYAKEEEFLIKNAQITAEGALDILFSETPHSVYGSKLLITGYGRIGKILSRLCKALGADVSVAARKERDLSWIELSGCRPLRYERLEAYLGEFDMIVNTVPERIFGTEEIASIKQDCLFVDLASVPGGIDWDAAGEAGLKTIWALSLPGKVAPYSSGNIIADTLTNLLETKKLSHKE